MIHILLCPHKLAYGGAQLSLHHWAKYLDTSRFKVSVLAMARGGLSEKFEAHYPVYYDDEDYSNITRYIEELRPDIVHCGPPGGKDFDYIKRASQMVPVTETVMCPRQPSNYEDVTASVVLSKFVLSLQERREDVYQIDAPFDLSDYSQLYGREYFGLPEDKLIVGSLGNERRENTHFMKIARHYKDRGVHFVIKTNKNL